LLHKADHSPIRFARVCRKDGREVPWRDVVKGYEFGEGDYVVIDQKELEKADARKTKSIEILSFCGEKEIGPDYFDKPYVLEPLKGAEKPYALLRDALAAAKRVGLAKIVFTNREHLAALKAQGDALALNTLRFQSQLKKPELKLPGPWSGRKEEMQLAVQLIQKMSSKFSPGRYKDSFTDELKSFIERKAHGRPLPKGKAEREATRVPDLMAALRASLKSPQHGAENRTIH
jgi:DNA end-binding protein Ku